MGYIYKITNRCTDKSYIGYTENPKNRWLAHQHKSGSKLVWQAIKKYGLDNISFEVIAQDSVDNENNYIVEHNTIAPNGYNIVPGGGLPPNHKGKSYAEIYGVDRALEQRAKRQVKQLAAGGYGPVKHTEETKRKISDAVAGKNNPMYGRKHDAETLAKMSEAKKGKMAGANNPTAKQWKLTSPTGEIHLAHGNLRQRCKELGLSFATVHAAHMLKRKMRSGWEIEEI
jgi:group I intron endonuclease